MRLDYKRTCTVSLAFFAICAFWQLYDHAVPLMLKYTFRTSDTFAGGVMAIDNVLALFMLPLFGMLSDRTKTRFGRRMPYIALGGLASCAAMMSIPALNGMALAGRANLAVFLAALAFTLLLMATYRSPAVALMPDVTPKPLRSKANAVINLAGAVGGIIVLGLTKLLLPASPRTEDGAVVYTPDYTPIFLCCAAIMAAAALVLVWRVREPRWALRDSAPAEEKKPQAAARGEKLEPPVRRSMLLLLAGVALWFMGYNAITTSFSKYCVERFGMGAGDSALVLMIATGAAIVSYIPVGFIATRIGRKRCIQGGIVLLAASFCAGIFFSSFTVLIYPLFITAGIAWAAINVNSYPMVVEMSRGADVGKFTGYYYTASMAAQVATPVLSGLALDNIGYETLFPYSALFVGLSFVTLLFVRHGDARPGAAGKPETFDA